MSDGAIRRQVLIEGLKVSESRKFSKYLDGLRQSIASTLEGPELSALNKKELRAVIARLKKELGGEINQFLSGLTDSMLEMSEQEVTALAAEIGSTMVDKSLLAAPTGSQVASAAFSQPLQTHGYDGVLLSSFLNGFRDTQVKRLTGIIRVGVLQGKTNTQITHELIGRRLKNGYSKAIIDRTERDARAIVSTTVQHISSVARNKTYQRNTDLFQGYRWISTLDSRTSAQCRTLDGQLYKIGKGPMPPIHINCRSTTAPELLPEFQNLSAGRTRPSESGQQKGSTSYYQWLKTQPKEFVSLVLGPKRAKLLLSGGLSAERFSRLQLDRTFRPITLEQMRKIEPVAFDRAGI